MTYGSMEASTSFSCQEVDGSVADIRWRLKRLLEDYAAVLSRLSLAHLSQNADGMRLLESQLFDTARRDLAESDDTFSGWRARAWCTTRSATLALPAVY